MLIVHGTAATNTSRNVTEKLQHAIAASIANLNITTKYRNVVDSHSDSDSYEDTNIANFVEDLVLRDSLYIVVPLTVLYSFILIAGILGNLINCWVITKIKRMHTTTNYYLFSLSVSDLLLLTSGLPQEIYFIWFR